MYIPNVNFFHKISTELDCVGVLVDYLFQRAVAPMSCSDSLKYHNHSIEQDLNDLQRLGVNELLVLEVKVF